MSPRIPRRSFQAVRGATARMLSDSPNSQPKLSPPSDTSGGWVGSPACCRALSTPWTMLSTVPRCLEIATKLSTYS
eukprot:2150402-Lingulodinium_polyedra.AAC.1